MLRGVEARELIRDFSRADDRLAARQLINTVLPYVGLWLAMIWAPSPSVVLLLSVLAALFLVRLFVIQHDCGHGSLFSQARTNDWVGSLLGVLTLTPHYNWRVLHNLHHATSGNLDRRQGGDIWLMTVDEFRQASALTRLRYRLFRHPLFLFVIGPGFYFLLRRRFPVRLADHLKKAKRNVYLTDLGILLIYGTLGLFVGLPKLLLMALPVTFVSASIGVWLFYIQHYYEGAYWRRGEEWDHFDAGFSGSSYYELPKWLHWFTADIAVHHIHHVDSRVPNYRLQECMRSHPALEPTKRLSLRESFSLMRLSLWDESKQQLVGFTE